MDSWRYMGKKFEVTKVECGWHWGVRDKIGKVKFCIICECHTVCYNKKYELYWASLVAQLVKNPAAMQETPLQFLGQEDPWRRDRLPTPVFLGFPSGSVGKESTCIAGDLGAIPGLGRSPGKGNSYPLQCSGLENSMDCIVHGVAESQTWLSDFHLGKAASPEPVAAFVCFLMFFFFGCILSLTRDQTWAPYFGSAES